MPTVRPDRNAALASADVVRNAPLIRQKVQAWLEGCRPGSAEAGARIFCEPQWTALTADLADLIVADCGPRLAEIARQVVAGAGATIESAVHRVSEVDQQRALARALASVIAGESADAAQAGARPLLSEPVARCLGQVRADVQGWTRDHKGHGSQVAGLAGPHVVANIVFACGLRSIVQQLRQQAQSPTPASRWIEGRQGLARASEADLYGWLEKMCLDVGHGHDKFDSHEIFVAPALNEAHKAIKQFCEGIRYSGGFVLLHTPTPSPKLVKPGLRIVSAPSHPLGIISPSRQEEERTPSSRSVSQGSQLSAHEFATGGATFGKAPVGLDD